MEAPTPEPATPSSDPAQPTVLKAASSSPSSESSASTESGPSATSSTNYASFLSRFAASSIDALIIVAINFLISLVIQLPIALLANSTPANQNQAALPAPGIASLLTSLLSLLVNYGYYIYFIGSRGQTLGKMALKIKVVKADSNEKPSYGDAFLREVIGKIASAVVLGLGYLWMLWDEKKQTWHDKIAKTIVVKA